MRKKITERDGWKIGDRVRLIINRPTRRTLTGTVVSFGGTPGVVIVQRDGVRCAEAYSADLLERLPEPGPPQYRPGGQ